MRRHDLSVRDPVDQIALALADDGLDKIAIHDVGTLADGLQKRPEIARALVGRPRILVLDEPAAGLGASDWEALAERQKQTRDRMGFAMILIDHNLAFVRYLARGLAVLAAGKTLRVGTLEEVLSNPEVRRLYLGGNHAGH